MTQLTAESIRSIVHNYMTEHAKEFGLTYWMKNKFCDIRQEKLNGNPCKGCESESECKIATRLVTLYGDIAVQQAEISTMRKYIASLKDKD